MTRTGESVSPSLSFIGAMFGIGHGKIDFIMYLVPVSFTNRHGEPFHWDFQCDTDDHAEAIREAVVTFFSGLTLCEREDANKTIKILAHPYLLPHAQLPVR